jgi:triosephosphate isomerase
MMSHGDTRFKSLILINFKTYMESTGKKSVDLSRKIEEAGRSTGVNVAVAPQFCDIAQVAANVSVPVFSQHVDPMAPGAFTGHILAESVKAAGASGTVLNHSEKPVRVHELSQSIDRARELNLATVVCAGDVQATCAVSLLNPDMVAIEPPELIGSGRAVSKSKPEIITEAVKQIRRVNRDVKILCGAGVSSGDDVFAALKLGAEGVLVASAVVKSENPSAVVSDMCDGVRRFSEGSS